MNTAAPRYHHTQRAPLYLVLVAGAAAFAGMLAFLPMPPAAQVTPAVAMTLFGFLAFCFKTFTVSDQGDHLLLRFGPLPVFKKRIPYAAITEVRRSRSRFVDGWGIHKVLGRGWTWNLWGFDCAELRVDGQTLRVGSDDADGLVRFLRERIAHR